MREKLISCLDYLFENAPEGASDLKSEITANSLDRYDDLIREGKSADAAFNAAIAGIGDVNILLREYEPDSESKGNYTTVAKRAMLLSSAVALYILSLLPVILLDRFNEDLGASLMFLMIAVATGMIIYRATAYKQDDASPTTQAVEIRNRRIKEKDASLSLNRALIGALWALGLVIYFIVSFLSGSWHITWLIFPICAALSQVIRLTFEVLK